MSYITSHRPVRRALWPFFLALTLLLGAACWVSFQYSPPVYPGQMEMKKSPGRNESHANQKARERTEEEYQKAKDALGKLEEKIQKTKEDNKMLEKLRDKVKHWKKKKDWKGENHSQKNKGN